jgi:hypothetical protein
VSTERPPGPSTLRAMVLGARGRPLAPLERPIPRASRGELAVIER